MSAATVTPQRSSFVKKKLSLLKRVAFLSVIVVGAAINLTGCNTLQSIEISRGPEQTVIGQGQALDPSGMAVTVTRSRDTAVIADARGMAISGFDSTRSGQQTVTVSYGRGRNVQSAVFTVTVVPVAQLTITQVPAVTMIMEGDDFDPRGFAARVEFENEAVPGIEIGPGGHLGFSGFDRNASGVQTVTASFFGGTDTFEVRVAAFLGIEITSPPTRTEYFVGEELDLGGLAVLGRWYGYQRSLYITRENLSNFDINRSGQQEVIITYLGSTASFSVTYVGFAAITIANPPSRLSYEQGEYLNLAGMLLQGTREGSTTIEMLDISRAQISGHNRFQSGEQTITVSFGGRSDTFRVTIGPSPLIGPWHGTLGTIPILLIMTANTWTMSWPERIGITGAENFSGTFTRDTQTGAVEFSATEGPPTRPRAGDLLSANELIITGSGLFPSGGVTFTR